MSANPYRGREEELADIFGATAVRVADEYIELDGRRLPVVDGVIVALPESRRPSASGERGAPPRRGDETFAPDIQETFGAEWTAHGSVLPEHADEFSAYFDLVDLAAFSGARVVDLGCGSGRWATFVAPRCRSLVVVDFSDAIFVARRNLTDRENVVFVMADVLDLPFRDDAFDFAYCLGVLHHLPVDALAACRRLSRLSQSLLVYLYYALDNRPGHYRVLLGGVTAVRKVLSRVRNPRARSIISFGLALTLYKPLAETGARLGRYGRSVPLADTYAGKSLERLTQDVYDRFFTRIEQRFTRQQIRSLEDTFATVEISPRLPYWHFLCSGRR